MEMDEALGITGAVMFLCGFGWIIGAETWRGRFAALAIVGIASFILDHIKI